MSETKQAESTGSQGEQDAYVASMTSMRDGDESKEFIIISKEAEYLRKRRCHVSEEYNSTHEQPGASIAGDARPVGLALSGGGIRSTAYSLGILQGLSKLGILPWVDYLSSVSGGGFSAAAMTDLLTWKTSDPDGFHFNTHWGKFPFNPGIKAISADSLQDPISEASNSDKFVSHDPGINQQLRYLRDHGNWLVPRLHTFSLDVMQGIGTLVGGIGYTLTLLMLALVVLSGFHYVLSDWLSSDTGHCL